MNTLPAADPFDNPPHRAAIACPNQTPNTTLMVNCSCQGVAIVVRRGGEGEVVGSLQIKGEEVTTLAETVRNLEVKIRLINQKLRVTEQTLNEKEGDHTGKEDKLHQENNSLRERISALSDSIANYKESQEFVKKEIT
ncbi:hypothetical protein Tco_0612633 [Tanacetum coccineum]